MTTRNPVKLVGWTLVLAATLGYWSGRNPSVEIISEARALPLYSARAGRMCDNCHTDPTGWKNPELVRRKCNLSCLGCHVNPTGGGLRTVSGRFYGQTTLPMFLASHRPAEDQTRHLMKFMASKERRNRVGELAFGKPPLKPSSMAFDESRYANLRADPLITLGFDARIAAWFAEGAATVFPMQSDLHVALHPLPYLTAYATAGVIGKSQGYPETFGIGCRPNDPQADCVSRARKTFFMVKDAFVMTHQFPLMSYARIGRFLPPFGTMHEDHTLPTRRDFELDHGSLHSRVFGAEIGMAPNYPYFHLAFFRPNRLDRFPDSPEASDAESSPDELPSFTGVRGWGLATSFGWRDLGYSVGFSGMLKRRGLSDGGNTSSLAINWSVNPAYFREWLPLTYLGEFVIGGRLRLTSGRQTSHLAQMHELDYLAFNGINFRFRYSYSDYDMEVEGDDHHRFELGADLTILPGVALSAFVRFQLNKGVEAADGRSVHWLPATVDGIVYLRGWY
jgi:predicted CXXCH cytochrome family protein